MMYINAYKTRLLAPLLLLSLLLPACGLPAASTSQGATCSSQNTNEVAVNYISDNTSFGLKLFQILSSSNNSANVVISPTSIALALEMTMNGASGQTQQDMIKTLGLQGISIDQMNKSSAALLAVLQNPDPHVQLNIANSLWANNDINLKQSFLQQVKSSYCASVSNLDFKNSQQSAATINNWVSHSTNGKITHIIDGTSPDQLAFLINALYFNGAWTYKFDPTNTQNGPFTTGSSAVIQQPLMHEKETLGYLAGPDFQAVRIPYGSGRMSMTVYLPSSANGLAVFKQGLSLQNLNTWNSSFSPALVDLTMPKFTVQYQSSLVSPLASMGMSSAFGPGADFSNMTDQKADINEVVHKTYIDVSENGTEAAAVTSVGVQSLAVMAPQPVTMVINHPFFFTITDSQTGAMLFTGAIDDPRG